ncbi:hypothetical protein KUTeg_000799 [Tegillarca granosa]|uniref:Uncharacterized protein n=1 Tax=Tegillarca granosa TaxID=220873 RepID=A0ABQ9FYK1_TEGGR|nr:hypothetical protein KUTeg_000799 [Tegillarca granosa]
MRTADGPGNMDEDCGWTPLHGLGLKKIPQENGPHNMDEDWMDPIAWIRTIEIRHNSDKYKHQFVVDDVKIRNLSGGNACEIYIFFTGKMDIEPPQHG